MSDDTPAAEQPSDQPERRTRSFRKYAPAIKHSPEQLRRQNDVLRYTWQKLREPGPVIAFLNTHHEHLGGQPLQIAMHSDDGLSRVEQLLGEISLGK